jgi:hypothetical protein
VRPRCRADGAARSSNEVSIVPWRYIAVLITGLAALGTVAVLRGAGPIGSRPEQAARASAPPSVPGPSPSAAVVLREPEPRAATRSFSLEWTPPAAPPAEGSSIILRAPEAPAGPVEKGTDLIVKPRPAEAQQRAFATPADKPAISPVATPSGPARAPAAKRAEPAPKFFNVWGVGF